MNEAETMYLWPLACGKDKLLALIGDAIAANVSSRAFTTELLGYGGAMSPEAIKALSMGAALGVVFGVALHSYILGLAIGVALAAAFHASRSKRGP